VGSGLKSSLLGQAEALSIMVLISPTPNQEENPNFAQPSDSESQHSVHTMAQNPA